jgi:uncharacterized Fe-S center protein
VLKEKDEAVKKTRRLRLRKITMEAKVCKAGCMQDVYDANWEERLPSLIQAIVI